jgi:hypothetical protein
LKSNVKRGDERYTDLLTAGKKEWPAFAKRKVGVYKSWRVSGGVGSHDRAVNQ